MSVWPGLGVNYKSINPKIISEDIEYFKKIGMRYIRVHIPSYNSSDVDDWKNVAKIFHDDGFFHVQWGISAGSNKINDALRNTWYNKIIEYAQICNDEKICHEYGLGNEEELHNRYSTTLTRSNNIVTAVTSVAHGFTNGSIVEISGAVPSNMNGSFTVTVTNSTTFTYTASGVDGAASGTIYSRDFPCNELRDFIRQTAIDVNQIFLIGDSSYQSEANTGQGSDSWASEGKGALDKISINVYNWWTSDRYLNPAGYEAYIQRFYSAFKDECYISEFNLEANNTSFQAIPDYMAITEMDRMMQYIKSSGMKRAQLYQWRGYKDSTDSDFNVKMINGDFKAMWSVLESNNGRSSIVNI